MRRSCTFTTQLQKKRNRKQEDGVLVFAGATAHLYRCREDGVCEGAQLASFPAAACVEGAELQYEERLEVYVGDVVVPLLPSAPALPTSYTRPSAAPSSFRPPFRPPAPPVPVSPTPVIAASTALREARLLFSSPVQPPAVTRAPSAVLPVSLAVPDSFLLEQLETWAPSASQEAPPLVERRQIAAPPIATAPMPRPPPPPSVQPSYKVPAPTGPPRPGPPTAAPPSATSLHVPPPDAPVPPPVRLPATFPSPAAYCAAQRAALEGHLQALLGSAIRAQRQRPSARGMFAAAELSRFSEAAAGSKRPRDGDGEAVAPVWMLRLPGVKEPASAFRKGQLWALSSDARFAPERAGWTAVVAAAWHGPDQGGKLAVRMLSAPPPGFAWEARYARGGVYALRLELEAGHELEQLDALASLAGGAPLPLLPLLLGGRGAPAKPPALSVETVSLMEASRLNEDQAQLVQEACAAAAGTVPRLLLVQGPFGCGKTHTLCALVRRLVATCSERILLVGFTNACVDGLLCALLDAGFTDFVRCGSLRRIAPRVLQYAVGSGSRNAKTVDERDLRAALAAAATAEERAAISAELAALAAGRSASRAKKLASCRLVASTICSCVQERLDAMRFPIVLLDEASQVTEPAALLPLVRFAARCVVAVGDPAQLPPLVLGSEGSSLGRPMLNRLVEAGHPVHLLRTQYRMHPALSSVPNALFYGGELRDGVSASERPPLLPGLPPLLFLDLMGKDSGSGEPEAVVVARLVHKLQQAGVPPADIAVLSFRNQHVDIIRSRLAGGSDTEACTISSTDAFQGQERPIIVISFAMLTPNFATDERVNVALSRARNHLICVGRAGGKCSNTAWQQALLRAARLAGAVSSLPSEMAPLPAFSAAAASLCAPPASQSFSLVDAAMDAMDAAAADEMEAAYTSRRASVAATADVVIVDPPSPAPSNVNLLGMGSQGDAASLAPCSTPVAAHLTSLGFSSADLYHAYRDFQLIAFATGAADKAARRATFMAGKLGRLLTALAPLRTDHNLTQPFARFFGEAESFVAEQEGRDAVRLSSLLACHADMATLRRDHSAFAWHVMREAGMATESCGVAPLAADENGQCHEVLALDDYLF